ncbi:MAG: TonB-dependent receptor plug domain-containing protein [Flavobacteriales bacterium]|nr:TonB-dependent receptor plug domain-containing protein [Flavobacteriales bacterium]
METSLNAQVLRLTILSVGLLGAAGTTSAQVSDSSSTIAADSSFLNPTTPIYTISADDLDAELGGQDISGILQSSRDLFTSTAAFNWGNARFRIRGYDSRETWVSINGVLMNNLETNWTSWSQWGGLNDVTRYPVIRTGINPTRNYFGGIGGFTDMDLRAGSLRPGLRGSFAVSNRAYNNRAMLTWNSGMSEKGWAFSVSGSRRWAKEGFVPGTSFDAYSYFVSVEKRFSARHSLGFIGFGAPIARGRAGLAVQEAYDLVGSNYYNPYWGYQDGEKRNSRVSLEHQPVLMLTHVFAIDSTSSLSTSGFFSFGRGSYTSLNWVDARDPRPDYYRYLPSYYTLTEPDLASDLTLAWQQDPTTQQVDWDQLYFANGKNLFTATDVNGIAGNNVTGLRSKYIVEDRRADPTRGGVNSVWKKELDERTSLSLGGTILFQSTRYFKTIDDLLGGEFWIDLDQFAQRDFADSSLAQNDLNNPNRLARQGDVFGYDYRINVQRYSAFGQWEKRLEKWDVYAAAELGYMSFHRNGAMVNGRFPTSSFGRSPSNNFVLWGLKGGATYKLNGRNYFAANAAVASRPPSPRISYLSPRTRDEVVPGLTDEWYYSGDINYLIRFPRLNGRATLYYTQFKDQTWARSFYHEEFLTLVNYSMTGVDELHTGVELALEAKLTSTWTMSGVYATGQHLYNSRPIGTITRDNGPEVLGSRQVYWKNFRVGNMPQTAASLGLKYNSPKYWFLGLTGNYFDHMYLDPNPDRRTVEALGNLSSEDPQWSQLLDQTRLDPGYTLDLFGGKSWMVKRKYRIALTVSVNNLLDETDLATGGFEQLRYDRQNVDRFPPRYRYMWGRTFFVMLSFSL